MIFVVMDAISLNSAAAGISAADKRKRNPVAASGFHALFA
jgi:hypothetical protein